MNNITKKIIVSAIFAISSVATALGIHKNQEINRRKMDMDDTLKRANTKVTKND